MNEKRKKFIQKSSILRDTVEKFREDFSSFFREFRLLVL